MPATARKKPDSTAEQLPVEEPTTATPSPSSPNITQLRRRGMRAEIEEMLNEKGVVWQFFDEIDKDLVDEVRSLDNQARFNPLNHDQVGAYKEAMQRGDNFPAVVLFPLPNGKYMVVDGNHRFMAAKESGYVLASYVMDVKTPARVVRQLTYEANAKHGLPSTQAERAEHAVWLIDNVGESIKMASARMNLPERLVSRYYNTQKADRRVERLRIPGGHWKDLVAAVKQRLNAVVADETFIAMVDFAWKTRMSAEEADFYVPQIRAIGSTSDQLAEVEKWSEELRERIAAVAAGVERPKRTRGPKQILQASLSSLVPYGEREKREEFLGMLGPTEVTEWMTKIDDTMTSLRVLRTELEAQL